MQSSEEREILFFDLISKTNNRKYTNLPPKSISFLVSQIKTLFDSKQTFHQYRNKTETLYIADIIVGDTYAKILVNRSDRKVADIILSDFEKDTRRLIEKKEGEGNDYSCHIIIKLDAIPSKPHTHLCLLEMSPGLGRAKVESFINSLIRKCKKNNKDEFKMNDPDGSINLQGEPKQISITSKIGNSSPGYIQST